jgi:hypothetical protein
MGQRQSSRRVFESIPNPQFDSRIPMAVTQIADIIQPAKFSNNIVENSMISTNFFLSGVTVPNILMVAELAAGSNSSTIPCWSDLGETEPNYSFR